MVAKQLEQHYSMNGAATGAILDSKVTGGRVCLFRLCTLAAGLAVAVSAVRQPAVVSLTSREKATTGAA
jgi:hypothetical protein